MGYPVFPKPFIEETILSSLCLLGTLAIYWLCGGYFWTLVFSIVLCVSLLPRWIVIKNPTDNAEDEGLILGSGRSSEEGNGNPLQYSCPDNPMGRGAWQATVHGVTESEMTEHICRLMCIFCSPNVETLSKAFQKAAYYCLSFCSFKLPRYLIARYWNWEC